MARHAIIYCLDEMQNYDKFASILKGANINFVVHRIDEKEASTFYDCVLPIVEYNGIFYDQIENLLEDFSRKSRRVVALDTSPPILKEKINLVLEEINLSNINDLCYKINETQLVKKIDAIEGCKTVEMMTVNDRDECFSHLEGSESDSQSSVQNEVPSSSSCLLKGTGCSIENYIVDYDNFYADEKNATNGSSEGREILDSPPGGPVDKFEMLKGIKLDDDLMKHISWSRKLFVYFSRPLSPSNLDVDSFSFQIVMEDEFHIAKINSRQFEVITKRPIMRVPYTQINRITSFKFSRVEFQLSNGIKIAWFTHSNLIKELVSKIKSFRKTIAIAVGF